MYPLREISFSFCFPKRWLTALSETKHSVPRTSDAVTRNIKGVTAPLFFGKTYRGIISHAVPRDSDRRVGSIGPLSFGAQCPVDSNKLTHRPPCVWLFAIGDAGRTVRFPNVFRTARKLDFGSLDRWIAFPRLVCFPLAFLDPFSCCILSLYFGRHLVPTSVHCIV